MKLMRLALCVAVFALVGGIAFSEDMDIRALQAKLAAQEARLNDLQAKMNTKSGAGTADNVVSLRKNAKVTIGGDFNVRMYQFTGKEQVDYGAGMETTEKIRATDHRLNDAKIRVKVDVNDYFEAYFRFDMQAGNSWRQTQTAYVRWKNLCNSGFSLLVGRNDLVYGGGAQHGATWSTFYGGYDQAAIGNSPSGRSPWEVRHIGFDYSRTNQITAAWENPEGTFKAEASYFQAVDSDRGGRWEDNNRWKSVNDGFGSGSARLTWKPIEGLNLVASAINMYNNVDYDELGGAPWEIQALNSGANWGPRTGFTPSAANHTAVDFLAAYEPCFFKGFKIWGMYQHDWNAGWVDNVDVDNFQVGLSYRFPKINIYALGEYMQAKRFGYDETAAGVAFGAYGVDGLKTKAYAFQTGFKYFIGYGVDLDVGYRYEKFKAQFQGNTYAKAYIHSVHARLNFNF